jgi:hypothetical protein
MKFWAKCNDMFDGLARRNAIFSAKIKPPFTAPKANVARYRAWTPSAIILIVAASLTNLFAQNLEKEEPEALPWEKGALQLGGFVATFNSELTFGLKGARNGRINGEDLLGLDSTLTVFRAEAMYRPGSSRRNQLDFAYGAYHRDANATLSRELTIEGQTYPVGAQVSTLLNFDLIRGTYSYAFVQNQWLRVALGLGVYAVPLRYGLEVETISGATAVEGGDVTLPLPALALRTEVRLIDKLFLKASADGMYLEISDFKGWIADINLSLEYRPWKHIGFGLGYNFVDIHAETESDHSDYPGASFVGDVDVRFSGLLFYGKISF